MRTCFPTLAMTALVSTLAPGCLGLTAIVMAVTNKTSIGFEQGQQAELGGIPYGQVGRADLAAGSDLGPGAFVTARSGVELLSWRDGRACFTTNTESFADQYSLADATRLVGQVHVRSLVHAAIDPNEALSLEDSAAPTIQDLKIDESYVHHGRWAQNSITAEWTRARWTGYQITGCVPAPAIQSDSQYVSLWFSGGEAIATQFASWQLRDGPGAAPASSTTTASTAPSSTAASSTAASSTAASSTAASSTAASSTATAPSSSAAAATQSAPAPPRFQLSKTSFRRGEKVRVTFDAAVVAPTGQQYWITVVAAGAPDTEYGTWHYLAPGVVTDELPADSSGELEVRLHDLYPQNTAQVLQRQKIIVK